MIMPESDPMATVEAMPHLTKPDAEGSCNMTNEGEYCPEHGLAECGMYEAEYGPAATAAIQQGAAPIQVGAADQKDKDNAVNQARQMMAAKSTVAKGLDPTLTNAGNGIAEQDDPINYNGAITGAYYESKSDTALLARIKSLALLK
jgi:hypothetical protein